MTALSTATADTFSPASAPRQAPGRRPLRAMIASYPAAAIAAVYLAVLIAAAAGASLVAPDHPGYQDLAHVLAGPSRQHWLGTDRLGRDVLSRLLFGARVTLLDVAIATAVFLLIGVPLGAAAGYRGGWLDRIVVRFADLLLAVPAIVVLLMVIAIFPGNDVATMIALGVIGCPALLRIVRGATAAMRGELYVQAARLSGLRTVPILRRHVLPRIAGPVIVQTTLFCAAALLAETGLSFLGLTRPETIGPSWGNMVGEASSVISQDSWLLIPTGGALLLTVMAFGLIGDAVRDETMGRSAAAPPLRRRDPQRHRGPATDAAGDSPAAVLSVRGLAVTLRAVPVLRDVSFAIEPGEALGIVGESGCGKSMTARAILGLLPAGGTISAGRIRFDDRDLTRLSENELSRLRGSGIALISQDPSGSLDPTFTVASQLREVIRRHRRLSRRQADVEARRLLELVRLPDPEAVLHRRQNELSGGMAQRVCIALALAAEPKLLIADEPTTALDLTVQAEILALLRDLQHRLGMAILLITHDWGVLADVCQRALVMYAGEIVESGDVADLHSRPTHPYTAALLAANPHNALTGKPLPAIPGVVPAPGHWPDGCHFQARCPHALPSCGTQPVPVVTIAEGHLSRCLRTEELTANDHARTPS
jgi:peptide/nickel transport system permease protein